jgi:hypothetical protein
MPQPPSKGRSVELALEDKLNLIKESETVPKPTLKVRNKRRYILIMKCCVN